jgi:RyR domain
MKDLDFKTLERLAEAVHMVWMEGKLRDGWKYGTVTEKEKKIHSCLVPYEQLSEADKKSDRDIVLRIQEVLTVSGYKIIKIDE